MGKCPELIVMLTHNDRTVTDAYELFDQAKDSDAVMWGLKEDGLSLPKMKELYGYMRECGKSTFLEVVAYTEHECMDGARMALDCQCEYLMGTVYSDTVNKFCYEHGLKYLPFVGNIRNRPSILEGTMEGMIDEASRYCANGVYGIDLLGYRYTGNAVKLIDTFVNTVTLPVCVAGSVNSFARLDEIKLISPWAFTIGGAFFEHKFGGSLSEQINTVCRYMHNG